MKVALLSTLLLPSATFAIGPIAPTENDAVTTRTYTDAGCVTIASAMTAKANVCAPISTTATARVTTTYPSGSSTETRLFTTTVYTDLGCGTKGGAALPIGAGSSTIQEGVCQQKAGSTTLWEQAIRFSETKNTVLAGVYTEKTCTTPGVNPLYLHTEESGEITADCDAVWTNGLAGAGFKCTHQFTGGNDYGEDLTGTFTYEAWLASPICAGTATATFGPVAPSVCTEITDTLAAQALKCTDTTTCFLAVYPIGLNTPTSGASTSVLASGAALLATGAAAALLL